jgi:hypothetical protein
MQPMKSQVRVGSPLLLAKWHHEGRGEKAGGKGWEIKPIHGKALAFPVAQGGWSLKGIGLAKGVSVSMIRGKLNQRVHFAGKGAAMKTVTFKSYGYHKRSAKFMGGTNMAVVQSVHHPGYPARPLLPPPARALEIATAVAQKYIANAGKG